MKKLLWLFLVASLTIVATVAALAQANGIQPGTVQVGGPDVIGASDLNIHLSIPFIAKTGIGLPFSLAVTFNNNFWRKHGASPYSWSPAGGLGISYGWFIPSGGMGGGWQETTFAGCSGGGTEYSYSGYYDAGGSLHTLKTGATVSNVPGCAPTTATRQLADGTGTATLTAPGAGLSSVMMSDGTTLIPRGTYSGPANSASGSVLVDSNGNSISWNDAAQTYTDTYGVTELTRTGAGTPSSPYVYTYPTESGAGSASVTVNFASYTVATNFHCQNVATEYPPTIATLISSIVLGDGSQYTFTYEPTPGDNHTPPYVTGRIASVTWPTGGTTLYTYLGTPGSNLGNGINCMDATVPGLTRQTPDGTWTYTRHMFTTPLTTTTTSPVDSSGHSSVTVYTFTNVGLLGNSATELETQKKVFQDSISGTLLLTTTTCYNGNTTGCVSATPPTLPLSQTDVYVTPSSMSQSSRATTFLDAYGNVTQMNVYDFTGALIRQTVTPVGTWVGGSIGCTAVGNGINNRTCYRNVYDGSSNIKRSEIFSYDSHGNLTTDSISPSANIGVPGNLTKSYTYNPNGTISTFTDVNGAQTVYSYNGSGGCNSGLPTSITMPTGIVRTFAYDCNGAVVSTLLDVNQHPTTFAYQDPFWRVTSVTDPSGAVDTTQYSPNSTETMVQFSSSITDVLKRLDSMGRVYLTQVRQGPNASTGDTRVTGYDSNGRSTFSSLPFSCTWGSTSCTGSAGSAVAYDALNRVTSVADSGGGTLSTSISDQDTLTTLGPAPMAELLKQVQAERDGLGRVKSTCLISSSPGSVLCGQATGGHTGFLTSYTYDAVGNLLNATRTSGSSQSRAFTYDGLSRVTSAQYPESGQALFFYDVAPSTPGVACAGTYNGDLVKKYDANGNTTCYTYDALHRVLSIVSSGPNFDGANKFFVYDNATVNGVVMQNGKGKLVEAYTSTTQNGAKITDLAYSYDSLGRLTDLYEYTPHSGGYYHTSATYAANGALLSVGGLGTQQPLTYGLDGEGRLDSVMQGTNHLVSGTTYNAAGQPLTVLFGSGDSDSYTYAANTGRMQSYSFTIGSVPKSMVGNLTWNANGTLRQIAIADGFNSTGTQTCNFGDASNAGYDDVGRLARVDCGATWQQVFTYDGFNNLTKTVPVGGTGISWAPGYNSSNNHYSLAGTSYDNNGNLLNDTFHVYTWNQDGRPLSIDASSCGTNGTCLTYDAMGDVVEKNVSGTNFEIEYSPIGKVGVMNGQGLIQGYLPLPGGARFSPAPDSIWHSDWLGSVRVASQVGTRAVTFDRSFAPFGETYNAVTGGTTNPSFTGDTQDIASGIYDTPNRELSPVQGRWLSVDPVHAGWNGYSYAGSNPLSFVDPAGLQEEDWSGLPHLMTGTPLPRPNVPFGFGGGDGGVTCMMDDVETDCSMVSAALESGAGALCPDPGYCKWGADQNGNPQFLLFDDPTSQALYRQGMASGTVLALCSGSWSNPTQTCTHTSVLYNTLSPSAYAAAALSVLDGWETNEIAVIGKLGELDAWAARGYNVFNASGTPGQLQEWNQAWIDEVIANEQPVIIGSDLTYANVVGNGTGLLEEGVTSFGGEIGALLDAGYTMVTVEEAGEVLLVLALM